jgi:hypothetical protein
VNALSNDELVRIALIERPLESAWHALVELHFRASQEVFDLACKLTESEQVEERVLGCNILGQLGTPDRVFPRESTSQLLKMLAHESHPSVVASAIIALSQIGAEEAIDVAKEYCQHWDSQVRCAIASSLGSYDCDIAGELLILLSADKNDEVREWATYWLGFHKSGDTNAVLRALRARLLDAKGYIRKDAKLGLERKLSEMADTKPENGE